MSSEKQSKQSAEKAAPKDASVFDELVQRVNKALTSYTEEVKRRVREYDEEYKVNDKAKAAFEEASNRVAASVGELDRLSRSYVGVSASELPVMAYTEALGRASEAAAAINQQAKAIDSTLQARLSDARERVGVALSGAVHAASTFPQAAASRVHSAALAIDKEYALTGYTAASLADLERRLGLGDRATELARRFRLSEHAFGLVQRGRELDEAYLGGRATKAVEAARGVAAPVAAGAGRYIASERAAYDETRRAAGEKAGDGKAGGGEASGAGAEAAKEDAGASGGLVSRAWGAATTVAAAAATRAAAIDEAYNVTGTTAATVTSLAGRVDERLAVSERAARIAEDYRLGEHAASALQRGRELDEAYLGGRATAVAGTASGWASASKEYVAGRMEAAAAAKEPPAAGDHARNAVGEAGAAATTAAGDATEAAKDTAEAAKDTAGAALDRADDAVDSARGRAGDAAEAAKDTAGAALDRADDAVDSARGRAGDAAEAAKETAEGARADVEAEAARGAGEARQAVRETAEEASDVVDAARDAAETRGTRA